jgi:hypothetical protein
MHFLSSFIIAFCALCIVVSAIETNTKTKKFHEVMENFLKKHNKGVKERQAISAASKHLREQSISLATNTNGNKDGWFESVVYSQTWYKNCKHPWFKDVALLNACALSDDLTSYTTLSLVAHPNYNSYTVTQTYFTDSACTQPSLTYSNSYPILICSYDALFHVIPQPLNPATDNLNGFAYGVFTDTATCSQGTASGLLEAFYLKLSYCYESDEGDIMWSNCSNIDGTLTQTTYNSVNGSCKDGVKSTVTWTQADTCSNGQSDVGSGWYYGGPVSFVCEN